MVWPNIGLGYVLLLSTIFTVASPSSCFIFMVLHLDLHLSHFPGDVQVTGGTFTSNTAYFGGFLYAIGDGKTTCEGTAVVNHNGVEGGAIYAADDAIIDCSCHLIGNKALSGPAM